MLQTINNNQALDLSFLNFLPAGRFNANKLHKPSLYCHYDREEDNSDPNVTVGDDGIARDDDGNVYIQDSDPDAWNEYMNNCDPKDHNLY